jgi:hypothetical protein
VIPVNKPKNERRRSLSSFGKQIKHMMPISTVMDTNMDIRWASKASGLSTEEILSRIQEELRG